MFSTFDVQTHDHNELLDITSQVQQVINKSKVTEGLCIVYIPHTTAGVTINENADPSVMKDINRFLSKAVPAAGDYSHAEGNSDAHIKASMIGSSVSVIMESGQLVLGTWQGIYFCEFDGPRTRSVIVKV